MNPACKCHGVPMKRNTRKGSPFWECRVKARERQNRYEHSAGGRRRRVREDMKRRAQLIKELDG